MTVWKHKHTNERRESGQIGGINKQLGQCPRHKQNYLEP